MTISAGVPPGRRFSKDVVCPICGGRENDTRGDGKRCRGFLASDATYAHCSREDYAGSLTVHPKTECYPHRLQGPCKCGATHGAEPASSSDIEATYDYRDESGSLLFQVVRQRPKTFRQRRPDGDGWTWSVAGVRRVPFRLQKILDPETANDVVLVVEGEKDVLAAEQLGFLATCNPGGAGKWQDAYSAFLRGHRAIVVPDADEPGKKHAAKVIGSLVRAGIEARVLHLLPDAKDLAAWLEAGGTREALLALVDAAAEPPRIASLPSSTGAEIFLRVPPETPWIAYPLAVGGCATAFSAAPKAGKSTYLLAMCDAILAGREWLGKMTLKYPIVYLTEEGPTTFRHALQRANFRSPDIHVTHQGETLHLESWGETMVRAREHISRLKAGLLIVDTFTTWARIAGEDENQAGKRLEAFAHIRPILSDGVGVILVGHTRKSGGDVIDSGRGSGALAGAVDVVADLQRHDNQHTQRQMRVIGRLDGLPDDPLVLDRDRDNGRFEIVTYEAMSTDVRADVLGHVTRAVTRGLTMTEIKETVGRRAQDVAAAVRSLEQSGEIFSASDGGKRGKFWRSRASNREQVGNG